MTGEISSIFRPFSLGFAGICGELWLISSFLWLLARVYRVSLAFVDELWHLWAISGVDACGVGIWGGLLGNHYPVFLPKKRAGVHKMCG
jgi:hypothetical protein